jgi:hypothetical protein
MKLLTLLNIVASLVSIPAGVVFLGDRFGLWSLFNNPNYPAIALLLVLLADFALGSKPGNYL